MDDFKINNMGNESADRPIPLEDDKPIPFDDEPISLGEETAKGSISHKPLNLAGGGGTKGPEIKMPTPTVKKAAEKIVSVEDRITGVKTFFTKLHSGAIVFLDEQITDWLRKNPGIKIKRTNTVSGDLVGKKTEPSIIITIWY